MSECGEENCCCTEILTVAEVACREGRERRRLPPGPRLHSISPSNWKVGLPASAVRRESIRSHTFSRERGCEVRVGASSIGWLARIDIAACRTCNIYAVRYVSRLESHESPRLRIFVPQPLAIVHRCAKKMSRTFAGFSAIRGGPKSPGVKTFPCVWLACSRSSCSSWPVFKHRHKNSVCFILFE